MIDTPTSGIPSKELQTNWPSIQWSHIADETRAVNMPTRLLVAAMLEAGYFANPHISAKTMNDSCAIDLLCRAAIEEADALIAKGKETRK